MKWYTVLSGILWYWSHHGIICRVMCIYGVAWLAHDTEKSSKYYRIWSFVVSKVYVKEKSLQNVIRLCQNGLRLEKDKEKDFSVLYFQMNFSAYYQFGPMSLENVSKWLTSFNSQLWGLTFLDMAFKMIKVFKWFRKTKWFCKSRVRVTN